jgi:acyl-CoA synthetase (AMP-forming)/AMP-acid ligase II
MGMIFQSPDPDVHVPEISLPDFVMARFSESGDRPALIDAATGRTVTYAQLAAGARQVAVGLIKRGMEKGDVFAILLPNLPGYAVVLLGVASAAGVATTMNPLMTTDEIKRQLTDTGARWLLTIPALVERAAQAIEGTSVREVFCVRESEQALPLSALMAEDGPWPKVNIDPENDLLVLPYSSGTSGLPKGVMITHRNMVAQMCQAGVAFPGGGDARVVAAAPFSHILGMVLVLYVTLQRGGTIVSIP